MTMKTDTTKKDTVWATQSALMQKYQLTRAAWAAIENYNGDPLETKQTDLCMLPPITYYKQQQVSYRFTKLFRAWKMARLLELTRDDIRNAIQNTRRQCAPDNEMHILELRQEEFPELRAYLAGTEIPPALDMAILMAKNQCWDAAENYLRRAGDLLALCIINSQRV